ncbi:hypothetical protein ALC57_17693 [Trachymyrmex cornetzi]|uniref:Uncharacterized protein n=1 Tax=Trachymyrmex cornetzi TaxID=471704 RepID=A0A151IT53_9HYME|nr:hypothetical protein ALC57_17693 [Trachymyrmex cornetzi]
MIKNYRVWNGLEFPENVENITEKLNSNLNSTKKRYLIKEIFRRKFFYTFQLVFN